MQQAFLRRRDIHRVEETVGLMQEGLTLAGVRRVFELQHQVDVLHAELAAARAALARRPPRAANDPTTH